MTGECMKDLLKIADELWDGREDFDNFTNEELGNICSALCEEAAKYLGGTKPHVELKRKAQYTLLNHIISYRHRFPNRP
jgi:hypothetical protein